MKTPPASSLPPAVGPGHIVTPVSVTFDAARDANDSGWICVWRKDDQPDASLICRFCDTPRNREVAAFIIHACNTSAALEARIAALVGALAEISNRAGNTEDDLSGAWAAQHALAALTSVQQP